jgi:hypothetical protein
VMKWAIAVLMPSHAAHKSRTYFLQTALPMKMACEENRCGINLSLREGEDESFLERLRKHFISSSLGKEELFLLPVDGLGRDVCQIGSVKICADKYFRSKT